MYRLVLILIMLGTLPATGHASELAICFEGDTGYSVKAPKDWISDNKMADDQGLCTIYVPQGTTFQNAPSIIFPRIIKSEKEGQSAIQAVIKDASEALLKGSKSLKVNIKADYTTKKKLKFTVREYLNGPEQNEFERVAYLSSKNTVYLVILSSRSQKDLVAAEAKFTETLENVEPVF